MTFIAISLLLIYVVFVLITLKGVGGGNFVYLLVYLVSFLPFYVVFQAFIYDHTESVLIVSLIKYSKEFVVFSSALVWIFGRKSSMLGRDWQIGSLDRCFMAFLGLSVFYTFLPLGEATIINKLVYLKNILLIGVVYFLGRQVQISSLQWGRVFKLIFVVTVLASIVVVCESFFGLHFHSLIGYAKYNLAINNIEPAGNYGLIWTFEAQAGQPRYGAFFSNPLEFSASMLVCFSIGVAYLLSVKFNTNRLKYLTIVLLAFVCVLFAYSRATMVTFFVTLVFMAFLLKYYKILLGAGITFLLIGIYVWFVASDDTRYFVLDTLTFQNSSSITHVLEWVEGIESMAQNPMGIGLAMSGNAGGVEDDLKVGGENQFLIYGVQLGLIGLILYISMIYLSIRHNWRAFRRAKTRSEQLIPFVAASVKFGLLLPLLTANAESYMYLSLVSWWMVGAGESVYQKYLRPQSLLGVDYNGTQDGLLNC